MPYTVGTVKSSRIVQLPSGMYEWDTGIKDYEWRQFLAPRKPGMVGTAVLTFFVSV